MPPTSLEKKLIQDRKMDERGWKLVPDITELMKSPIGVDTEEDARWLYDLSMKQVEREKIRQASYDNNEMVFSPSGLADCLRRVFLSKNHQTLGMERVMMPAPEPHYYFLTGDFIHLKWQFVLYKLQQFHPDFVLVDCEVPILSKRKDHGGTLDVICLLNGVPYIVDIKGLNVRTFGEIDRGSLSPTYRIQLTDYMMLFNSALQTGRWKPSKSVMKYMDYNGIKKFPRIETGILLAENKGGPDMSHPVALTEHHVSLKDNLPEVRIRLEQLREAEEKREIPAPECRNTRTIQFTGCPFAEFCFKEVREVEREDTRNKTSDPDRFQLARTPRRRRSRQA